ncbi:MAG: dehydrogenase E1 component subunit alpha/beta [Ignavibacteriales bacterium]|jgi:2-oxoisovalerate dehydrogenase E1 component|nr:dehydrogenase E1 component subunit alpha/beta [Ignavibacteriales bacterium]
MIQKRTEMAKTAILEKNSNSKKTALPNNGSSSINIDKATLETAYRYMYLARQIDTKAMNLLRQGKSFFHIAGAGHEAIQAALGLLLDSKVDWIFPYYRDLTLTLMSGMTAKDFFLSCFGKADDPATGGRQLPCHFGVKRPNLVPTQSSPTGTQFLQAVGTALASRRKGINNISYASSGEGTTSQGEFHEAVNWASREKLPVLFVIQNNKYAISVHVSQQSGGEGHKISEMMKGFANLKRFIVDGTDFFKSYQTVKEAIEYIKSGSGPALIEADTVRLHSHSSSDDHKKYRSENELKDDQKNDPIFKFGHDVLVENIFTEDELEEIRKVVDEAINSAVDEAAVAANPDPETAEKFMYDESGHRESLDYEKTTPAGKPIVMVDAINHALSEEMEINNDIYVFGEDIADGKGGVFTATKGLSSKYGNDRVFNSPLAEASIAGVATGMALAGLKPVVEIQFGDYIWPAFMQYKNETATFRYRSNNEWATPFVTRVAVGGYIHGGLYHSQNIESIFAHVPGLFIAYPSNAADAKGLLKTAIRLNDPVIFCEHKGLYRQSFAMAPEPASDFLVPFGVAKTVREGKDLTVITWGATVWEAVFAAKRLEDEGFSVEVIDIRTITPLDRDAIYNSVRKTGKAIVIHEDTLTGGFGGEIAALISSDCFEHLDGPVKRYAAKDAHIPYSPILEDRILPSREGVYKAIKELAQY